MEHKDKKISKFSCAVMVVAMMFGCFTSFAEVPISWDAANINGVQTLTQRFEVSKDTDPESLIDDGLIRDGYQYTLYSITKDTESFSEDKEFSQKKEYELSSKTASDAMTEAVKVMEPAIEYNDGEVEGTLYIKPGTLSIAPINERTVHGVDRYNKSFDFKSNDDELIPKTVTNNGRTYSLYSYTWSEVMSMDSVMPDGYKCDAIYTRGTSAQENDGYLATVQYRGMVKSANTLSYTVVYHGEPVKGHFFSKLFGSAKNTARKISFGAVMLTILKILGGLALLAILAAVILYFIFFTARIYYRDEFSGEEKVFMHKLLTKKKMNIEINTSKHPECNHYKVVLKSKAAERLSGKELNITADLRMIKHIIGEDGRTTGNDYEIPINLETPQATEKNAWQKAVEENVI